MYIFEEETNEFFARIRELNKENEELKEKISFYFDLWNIISSVSGNGYTKNKATLLCEKLLEEREVMIKKESENKEKVDRYFKVLDALEDYEILHKDD